MTEAAALRSGKSYRTENFPVASRLLSAEHRPPIMAFYEFVRTADDVADHAELTPTAKFALLDELETTLLGKSDSQPEAVALREIIAERGLDRRHAQEMLTAFRQDVTRRRYRSWDELIDYCRCSAMPVGRFVLDVCGEPRSTWAASDALCAALQVINHLQDCGDDYRDLNRVYLPLDILAGHGAEVGALALPTAGRELRQTLDDLCDRVTALLAKSEALARQVRFSRLALEVAVIQRLAERLVHVLRNRDPLSGRVHLSAMESAGFAVLGAVRGGTHRLVPISWPQRNTARRLAEEEPRSAAEAASGSSFYTAMRILPAKRRDAVFEIYAFCRAVDDIADEGGGDREERKAELDLWRRRIDSLYGSHPAKECAGLARATREFRLKREDFLAVIDGMEMDLDADIAAPSAETLDLYCDRVASAVGRLCVRVFGMKEAEGVSLAHHLGRALQLTNILRDLDEDAQMNRLYLPREELLAAGMSDLQPQAVLAHPGLDIVCRKIAEQASAHFTEADAIMAAAPRSAVRAPRIMANAYHAILNGLVRRGFAPPRERVGLTRSQIARIALRSLVL